MLYRGLSTMSKPRCQVESVSVPEADWVSVVPPNPPAAATARVYCTLAVPTWKTWTRLAVPAGVTNVAPPISVTAGPPLAGAGRAGVRGQLAPRVGGVGFDVCPSS